MGPGVAIALLLVGGATGALSRYHVAWRWVALVATVLGIAIAAVSPSGELLSFGGLSLHASSFASAAVVMAGLSLAGAAVASFAGETGVTSGAGIRHVLAAMPLGLVGIATCAMVADAGAASSAGGNTLPSDGSALAAVLVVAAVTALVVAVRPDEPYEPEGAAVQAGIPSRGAADGTVARPSNGGGRGGEVWSEGDLGQPTLVVRGAAAATLFMLGSAIAPRPEVGVEADTSGAAPAFLLVAAGLALRYGIVPLHRPTLRVLGDVPVALVPLLAAWLPAGFLLAALAWMETALDPVGAFLPEEIRILTVLAAAAALVGGAVAAARQADGLRLIGYLLVSDGGIALLALAGGPEARETARTWVVVNAVARTALVAWWIALRAAVANHGLNHTRGWSRHLPASSGGPLVVMFAVIVAATVGLPGWMLFDARGVLVDLSAGWPLRALPILAAWAGLAGFARLAVDAVRESGTPDADGEVASLHAQVPARAPAVERAAATSIRATASEALLTRQAAESSPESAPEVVSSRPATASVRLSATGIRWSGEARNRTEQIGAGATGPWTGMSAAGVGGRVGSAAGPGASTDQPGLGPPGFARSGSPRPGTARLGTARSGHAGRHVPGGPLADVVRLWVDHRARIALLAAGLVVTLSGLLSSAIVPLGGSDLAAAEVPLPAAENSPLVTVAPDASNRPDATADAPGGTSPAGPSSTAEPATAP